MKSWCKINFLISIFLFCLAVSVSAKNHVTEIDIDVGIRDDGSAYITQVWNGTFTEGTENYIPINTDGIEITDFKVLDINGEYEKMNNWNAKGSFEQKSRKYGINPTKDGVELCFGISEYGTNRYAIEYVIHNFINAYTDYDGTNFMFINPDMNTFPTDGKIRMTLANGKKLDESNSRIWAFGYSGQIEFQDGSVVAYTKSPLEGSNSMIVMLQLEKGIVTPIKTLDKSFEEVKTKAMGDSDYETDDIDAPQWLVNIFAFFSLLFLLAIPVLIVFWIVSAIKRKANIKKFYNKAEYFRDVPNNGDISTSYYLLQNFGVTKDKSLIVGATMLSMINKGCIEPVTNEKVNFMGKSKTEVSLELLKEPESNLQKSLYHILVSAAGQDKTLQEKELAKYCETNPAMLKEFIDSTYKKGASSFGLSNGFVKSGGNHIKHLSEIGKEQLAEVMGLKKYLLDFSLISEREIKEITIWQDYMVYATLFGIADKVIAQFKKVYPDRIVEFESYNRNVFVAHSYYRTMYNATVRAEQKARSAGMGGASSIGGGGGYSGGGSGGGSR